MLATCRLSRGNVRRLQILIAGAVLVIGHVVLPLLSLHDMRFVRPPARCTDAMLPLPVAVRRQALHELL